ncbi:hypothetical protein Q3G72_020483 [Acer saccharum]|nr:hypothetical protein Q3G72_020483 [Acer saccharum]
MAEEGRFTTIRVNTADSPDHGGCINGVVFELPIESPVSVRREDHNNLEVFVELSLNPLIFGQLILQLTQVGNSATKATIAGRELVEKQQTIYTAYSTP